MIFHKMLEEKNLKRICESCSIPAQVTFFFFNLVLQKDHRKILSARQDVAVWTRW